MNITRHETIDIETSGTTLPISVGGHTVLDLVIRGDGVADYAIDIREEGGSWVQNVGPTYTGASAYDDTLQFGAPELRIRCTTGTGTAGDSAEILLAAGGK